MRVPITWEWAARNGFLVFMCRDWMELDLPGLVRSPIDNWLNKNGPHPKRVWDLGSPYRLTIGELVLMRDISVQMIPGLGPMKRRMVQAEITRRFCADVAPVVPDVLVDHDIDGARLLSFGLGQFMTEPLVAVWLSVVRGEHSLGEAVSVVLNSEPAKERPVHEELIGLVGRLEIQPGDLDGRSNESLNAELNAISVLLKGELPDRFEALGNAFQQRRLEGREQ